MQEYRQLAFLRVVQGELLLKVGRAEEALSLAEDIYEGAPLSGGAYFLAVTAGNALGRTGNVIAALERWAHVTPPAEIVRLVEGELSLGKFVASAEYRRWKEKNEPAPEQERSSAATPSPTI